MRSRRCAPPALGSRTPGRRSARRSGDLLRAHGGIACGKSSVAKIFRAEGIPVVDADVVAREIVAPGTDGLAAVVARFGEGVLDPDGSLDRKKLGALVFADADARRSLNAITHPRIAARTLELRAGLEAAGHPIACYEAALLVENGLADAFRPLVVVAVAPEVQRARLMIRDGLNEAEADSRLASQRPLSEKIAMADHVVWNDGTEAELPEKVRPILAALRGAARPSRGGATP
ncbi:MAG: dephospho-CoA kinase [Polyangiaceae bacterium]